MIYNSVILLENVLVDYYVQSPASVSKIMSVLFTLLRCARLLEFRVLSTNTSTPLISSLFLPFSNPISAEIARSNLSELKFSQNCQAKTNMNELCQIRIGLSVSRSANSQYCRLRSHFLLGPDITFKDMKEYTNVVIDGIHAEATLYKASIDVFHPHSTGLLSFLYLFSKDIELLYACTQPEVFLNTVVPQVRTLHEFYDKIADLLPSLHSNLNVSKYQEGKMMLKFLTPDLKIACLSMFRDWIDEHANNFPVWLSRMLEKDDGKQLDGAKHSTSVIDLFSLLTTIGTSFQMFMTSAAPYILDEYSLTLVSSLITDILSRYCESLVETFGKTDVLLPPAVCKRIETDGLISKFKNGLFAEDAPIPPYPTSSSSANISYALVRTLFGLQHANEDPVCIKAPNCLTLTVQYFCVRVACIYQTKILMADILDSLTTKWNETVLLVKKRLDPGDVLDCAYMKEVPLGLFDACQSVISASLATLLEKLAMRVVYGEWRKLLIHELYVPRYSSLNFESPSSIALLDSTMENLYSYLGDDLFPLAIREIWKKFVIAFEWILQNGLGKRYCMKVVYLTNIIL